MYAFDSDWDYGHYDYPIGAVDEESLSDDEYSAYTYEYLDRLDDDDFMDYYYEEFILDQYVPANGGGTQPKYWWSMSRKNARLEHQPRQRRRDFDIHVPSYWKHGRDLADSWEARGRGKNRQLEQKSGETWIEFCARKADKQRRLRHTDRRKARQSIRTMRVETLAEPFDASEFISSHENF